MSKGAVASSHVSTYAFTPHTQSTFCHVALLLFSSSYVLLSMFSHAVWSMEEEWCYMEIRVLMGSRETQLTAQLTLPRLQLHAEQSSELSVPPCLCIMGTFTWVEGRWVF